MPHPAPQVTTSPPPIHFTLERIYALGSPHPTAAADFGMYAEPVIIVRLVLRPISAVAGEGRGHGQL